MKSSIIKSKTKKYELTILIPTFNEEYCIKKIIEETKSVLKQTKINYCILISDNNSSDNTIQIASKIKGVLINRCFKQGYGANLLSGINKINSKYTIFYDADGSYNPIFVQKLLKEIKKNKYDLVTYNRLKIQEKNSMPFLNKYFGTPLLSFLIRNIYGIQVHDCNSGMRIFKTKTLKNLNLKCTGMEFASEILVKLSIKNLNYKEFVLKFRKDYRGRAPHLKPFTDGIRHLKYIILNMFKSKRLKFF